MINLLNSGLSTALLSADSSVKSAVKPMNMISREMMKSEPNLGLIERAGSYGTQHLNNANDLVDQAQKELIEAQKTAKAEEKADNKAKLEKKAAENAQKENAAVDETVLKDNETFDTDNPSGNPMPNPSETESTGMSTEVSQPQNVYNPHIETGVPVSVPVTYTAKSVVTMPDYSVPPQIDIKA